MYITFLRKKSWDLSIYNSRSPECLTSNISIANSLYPKCSFLALHIRLFHVLLFLLMISFEWFGSPTCFFEMVDESTDFPRLDVNSGDKEYDYRKSIFLKFVFLWSISVIIKIFKKSTVILYLVNIKKLLKQKKFKKDDLLKWKFARIRLN
jgi:hypothetical protein